VYGVEELNGNDAWALFAACARGDLPRVEALVAKDQRMVNAQYWYQFPIHIAVRAGHAALVKLLLARAATQVNQSTPTIHGTSCFLSPKSAGIAKCFPCSSVR
jgi:Ankyrin repeats (3 copies)